MKSIMKNGHLTDAALRALIDGNLDDAQNLAAAGHASQCGECAGHLAECAESFAAASPPMGFAESAVLKLASLDAKKRREFYAYCARVAACAAVIIGVSLSGLIFPPNIVSAAPAPETVQAPKPQVKAIPAPEQNKGFLEKAGEFFSCLTGSIFNLEENTNDQTTK